MFFVAVLTSFAMVSSIVAQNSASSFSSSSRVFTLL